MQMQLKKMRNNLKLFLFFFLFISLASSFSFFNSTTPKAKCSASQKYALLLFKQSLFSINDTYYDFLCQDSTYYPIMTNWNNDTDCCTWDGVSCNHSTGDVIGIDLSCGMLNGIIYPNTTLFHLPHLQRLNLACNDFYGSRLPPEIGKFSKSLTHFNLSDTGLTGEIPSEIFFLSKLVSLDLSYTSFDFENQAHFLSNLFQNCTLLEDLWLNSCKLDGYLPTHLNTSSLKSLDLGYNYNLKGRIPNNIFNLHYLEKFVLVMNEEVTSPFPKVNRSTSLPLKWLDLRSINLLGELPESIGHFKSLNYLDLSDCGLVGSIPKSIVNLRHLTTLDLSNNYMNGTLPSFFTPSIESIDLSYNMFSGGLPSEFFNCRSLKRLDLSFNQFDGDINEASTPLSFIQLINLSELDISNNYFIGLLEMDTLFSTLPKLQRLHLSYSGLSVVTTKATVYVNPDFFYLGLASCNLTVFPKSIQAMKKLQHLDLSHNELQGRIPDWAGEIGGNGWLSYVDLSYNFITRLPLFKWYGVELLYLRSNQIQEPFPSSICNMSYLKYLDMSKNSFSGVIPICFINNSSSLRVINLGTNLLNGTIPNVFEDCGELEGLILNGNQLEGEVPSSLSKCQSLKILDLGNNQLNCTFPGWLGDLLHLQVLVLKSNNFHGTIGTSSSLDLPFQSLQVLDLSHNGFVGHLPQKYFHSFIAMDGVEMAKMASQVISVGEYYSTIIEVNDQELESLTFIVKYGIVDLSSNKFEGPFPPSICNMGLYFLDMSNNSFVGMIPQCFGNIISSAMMVDLGTNRFNGTIPNVYGECGPLQALILNGNQLEGEVPRSLCKCKYLTVLDIGNNHFNGTFPNWLGDLPFLRVLVLKSNNFHGPIVASSSTELPFPYLQVLDLSRNCFMSKLPQKYFRNFSAMKNRVTKSTEAEYFVIGVKYYSATFVLKGTEQLFVQVSIAYAIVDLSCNRFEGEIPNIIGSLSLLIVLNLSHNSLVGRIPHALGKLSEIESLDLSCNQLTGEIPQSLADLTFLEYLNLSQNDLMGRIPQGKQFDTFEGNSFGGNPRLCGLQLPKKCTRHPHEPQVEGDGDEEERSGFTWQAVMLGYGCGTLIGLLMGYLMLSTGRPKWFNEISDAVEHVILKRRNKRRYIFIGK